jgi:hypothetical protein
MKKIFLFLLKKYSKNEADRMEILKHLQEGVREEYREQTGYGNIYNFFIEFAMSNDIIVDVVKKAELDNFEMIRRGLNNAYNEAAIFIEKEM